MHVQSRNACMHVHACTITECVHACTITELVSPPTVNACIATHSEVRARVALIALYGLHAFHADCCDAYIAAAHCEAFVLLLHAIVKQAVNKHHACTHTHTHTHHAHAHAHMHAHSHAHTHEHVSARTITERKDRQTNRQTQRHNNYKT